jgi:transcriptional regulator with XRE-family HTH domain
MNTKLVEIGKAIQEARNSMKDKYSHGDYKQFEIAHKLGIGQRAYANIEAGQTVNVKLEHLLRLCEILECDITYLLGEHTTKRRETRDVMEITGLSERAVENLLEFEKLEGDIEFCVDLTNVATPDNPSDYNHLESLYKAHTEYRPESSKLFKTLYYKDNLKALNLLLENDRACQIISNIARYLFNEFVNVEATEINTGRREVINGAGLNDMYINRIIQGLRELKEISESSAKNNEAP